LIGLREDPEDYKAFEQSVTADFDVQTAVERELVLRLANLLWRLSVETGLLQIQSKIVPGPEPRDTSGSPFEAKQWFIKLTPRSRPDCDEQQTSHFSIPTGDGKTASSPRNANVETARCFLRLANVDNGAFERLTRCEAALCR
jgi:hypothetical protein